MNNIHIIKEFISSTSDIEHECLTNNIQPTEYCYYMIKNAITLDEPEPEPDDNEEESEQTEIQDLLKYAA